MTQTATIVIRPINATTVIVRSGVAIATETIATTIAAIAMVMIAAASKFDLNAISRASRKNMPRGASQSARTLPRTAVNFKSHRKHRCAPDGSISPKTSFSRNVF